MSETADRFECPACGKRFRWNAQIAGRKVRCTQCQAKLRVPGAPGGRAQALDSPVAPASDPASGDDVGYELADKDAPAQPAASKRPAAAATGSAGKCPSCNLPVKPGAVLCINCGFDLQSGRKVRTRVLADADDPAGGAAATPTGGAFAAAAAISGRRSGVATALERREDDRQIEFVDRNLPLIFMAVGVASILAAGIWASGDVVGGLIGGGVLLGVQLVILLPLLLIAALLSAKLQGITFGYFGQALLKLSSICLGPGVWGDVIASILLPWMPGLFLDLILLFVIYSIFIGIPLSLMFDLDANETIVTVCIIITVRIVAIMVLTLGGLYLANM